MDVQEEIGTHEDTPGRTRNLLRTDIIYSKYCNRPTFELRTAFSLSGILYYISYNPFAPSPPHEVENAFDPPPFKVENFSGDRCYLGSL